MNDIPAIQDIASSTIMFLLIRIILGHSWGSFLPRHCSSWWGYKTFKVELRTIFMRIIHFPYGFLDKKFPVQLHFNSIHSSLMTLV